MAGRVRCSNSCTSSSRSRIPRSFGGDAKDAFTVIVPSLPGYGFSGKPQRPISPRTIARLFDTLMTDVLKLPNYIAQGGDWGSAISCMAGL